MATISELARLSHVCAAVLTACHDDAEALQPAADILPHPLDLLRGTSERLAAVRRRIALGYYAPDKIAGKVLKKLADDVLKDTGDHE